MPDLTPGEPIELLSNAVRLEIQKAVADLRAGIISEVRNLILGQANVMHNLTVGQLNSLHAHLRETLQEAAVRVEEIQRYSTTQLMTTDLVSELLCAIDLKHQQYQSSLDEHEQRLESKACARADAVDSRFSKLDLVLEEIASYMTSEFQRLEKQISARAQELLSRVGQLETHTAGLAALEQILDRLEAIAKEDELIRRHIGEPVNALSQPVADFLNWATGHRGYASQKRLWFNHPLHPSYARGDVTVTHVNERLVELPFALEHLATLPGGSRVIDLGSTESMLALTIAALGHEVYAVDFRPYSVPHPRLKIVDRPVEAWEGPARPVDAIFCVSALEHVGIGAYGDMPGKGRLDLDVMRRFRQWLKPSGLMVFTAPYGPRSVDALQRTYNSEDIEELFAGWTILERRYYQSSPEQYWIPASSAVDQGPPEMKAVILLKARC